MTVAFSLWWGTIALSDKIATGTTVLSVSDLSSSILREFGQGLIIMYLTLYFQ